MFVAFEARTVTAGAQLEFHHLDAVNVVRGDRRMKRLFVGTILLLFLPRRRTSNRTDRLQIQAERLQHPNNESPSRQLLLDRRVNFRPVLGLDHLAITVDLRSQPRDSIGALARLREQLTPSSIIDSIFRLDALFRLDAFP